MDASILHDRIAATEKALIQLDERLDAANDTGEQEALLARIASLEERLSECLTHLNTLSTQQAEAIARIAEAEAEEAEAEAEKAEAEAEAVEVMAEVLAEPEETEEIADEGIVELEPEPESDAAVPEKPNSWWQNFLALR